MDDRMEKESIVLQEAEWIREQAKKRLEAEEESWEIIQEQQKLLDEKYKEIEEDLNQTNQMRRYHEGCREDMHAQVFFLHGISEDKLQGLKEYGNARFQGLAAAVVVCSAAFTVLCGYQYGVTDPVTLFMGACVGVESALLSQIGRTAKFFEFINKLLFLLPLPAMVSVFVCRNYYPEFLEPAMGIGGIGGLALMLFGILPYFLYHPYRLERQNIRDARYDLKELKQMAEKAVRRNRKKRIRMEKRQAGKEVRAAARKSRQQNREKAREERRKERGLIQEPEQKRLEDPVVLDEQTEWNQEQENGQEEENAVQAYHRENILVRMRKFCEKVVQ